MPFDPSSFRDLYPWSSHFLEVPGGHRLHYLDEGSGDPVLMLHGNPTWSILWRHLLPPLAKTNRCIVPDHVGCGLSDKPPDDRYDYILERRVADIEALVDHLRLGNNVTLALHDWGGMIGLAYAVRHPERIKRLMLFNTAGFGLPPGRSLPWQVGVVRYLPPFSVAVRGLNAFVRGAARTCSTQAGGLNERVRAAFVAPYDSWSNRVAIQRFVEDIPLSPRDRSYALVQEVAAKLEFFRTTPTFIGWGEHDFVFDGHFLSEWERRMPHAEIHRFARAGHYLFEDAHAELVPLVERFVARSSSS